MQNKMDNRTIGKDFVISKKLGQGAFGQVFKVISSQTGLSYAVKLQPYNSNNPQLGAQAKMLKSLDSQDSTVFTGIPKMHQYGTEGEFNYMVMQLLGKSIGQLLQDAHNFDLKTVLMLGIQMIERIEYLHSKNIIHRDIKPDNFVLGNGQNTKVYLIDFGLGKKYTRTDGSGHISYRDDKKLTGTARYASIYTHLGIEQGRRDDLQGLCHVLIYLSKGKLPWQRIKAKSKAQRYQKIMEIKAGTSLKRLCQGLPEQFIKFMRAVRKLQFEQKPDYTKLKKLLQNVMQRNMFQMDYQYCWMFPKSVRKQDPLPVIVADSHCS